MKIEDRLKHNQPEVYCELTENYCKLLPEDESLTTFFEKIEETVVEEGCLQPILMSADRIDTRTLNAEAITVDAEGNGTFSGELQAVSGSDDTLITFFEKIERTLDPICNAIRKAMRRFEINI